MRKKGSRSSWRTARWGATAVMMMMVMASGCLAGVRNDTASMTALDDQDLKQVHGAGLDADLLKQLQQLEQGGREQLRHGRDDQGRRALDAQQSPALQAALALQLNGGSKAATLALHAVNAGAQPGGTLIALTPVTVLGAIGMPLFGLPSLPSHDDGGSGNNKNNGR